MISAPLTNQLELADLVHSRLIRTIGVVSIFNIQPENIPVYRCIIVLREIKNINRESEQTKAVDNETDNHRANEQEGKSHHSMPSSSADILLLLLTRQASDHFALFSSFQIYS